MPSLKEKLVSEFIGDASISTLVGDRVFISDIPQDEARPHIVISILRSDGNTDLEGNTDDFRSDAVSIGCWSRSSMSSETLARAVSAFIADFRDSVINAVLKEDEIDQTFTPKVSEEYSVYGIVQTYLMFWYP